MYLIVRDHKTQYALCAFHGPYEASTWLSEHLQDEACLDNPTAIVAYLATELDCVPLREALTQGPVYVWHEGTKIFWSIQ